MTADSHPVLGGGDIVAAFNGKDENTKKVMEFLANPSYRGWSEDNGFISPYKSSDTSQFKFKIDAKMAKIGYNASVFRFDGSDQMPGAVGTTMRMR